MPHALPSHLEEVFPRSKIEGRLSEMAAQIDDWSRQSSHLKGAQPLLAVCVLRGGVFFFSDLLQRMSETLEPAFCRAWSYTKGVNGRSEAEVRINWLDTEVSGRDLILVDNICDSGRTLDVIWREAESHGARSVRTVAMVHRLRADSIHSPSMAGFVYEGSEWLVGYGLRDGELRSNWPSIYRVRSKSAPAVSR